MTGFAYLGALVVSLGGLAVLDRRFRLAFWADPARTAITLVVGVLFFLAWDVAGLALGIFARGDSPHMTGLQLAPELPVEEAVFLTLLCYNTLLVWRFLDLRLRGRDRREEVRAAAGTAGSAGTTQAGEAADGPTTGADA
ncbi:lycopene cyclase domain-containing protein [Oerskovia enterophila]|uniref:lycopene cyclase domain-containing protein n=1 Tax=Oerskovia enterophila TaxID=43678 RepID=UPI0038188178